MSNWQETTISLGTMRKNTSKSTQFIALPSLPEVIDVVADCGCTKLKYDPASKVLNVTYKAGEIPHQVQGNTQSVKKGITVIYKGNETERLFITATKTRF